MGREKVGLGRGGEEVYVPGWGCVFRDGVGRGTQKGVQRMLVDVDWF